MKIDITTKFEIGQTVHFFAETDFENTGIKAEQEMIGQIAGVRLYIDKKMVNALYYEVKNELDYFFVKEENISLEESKEIKAIKTLFDSIDILDEYAKQAFIRNFYKLRDASLTRKRMDAEIVKN